VCALGLCAAPLLAQDTDRIWGRVQTTSGEVHEGFIRWDRNEGSWVDILDGSKAIPEVNYLVWLAATDRERAVRTIELGGYRISWNEEDPDFPARSGSGVRFGHLASLEVSGRDQARVTLRSGETLELEGGSTDLGPSLRDLVVDVPGGSTVELDWEELERVTFSPAPSGARATSRRLYGTVRDVEGRRFTGYVSWDLDEILESDVLDGEDIDDGDEREVRFADIAAIERIAEGSRVLLKDGSTLELTGSNDVDEGHRGVQVSDPALGMVEVEWDEFARVSFEQADGADYGAFDGGHPLVGTVITRSGDEVHGVIRWDADEAASWELLRGRSNHVAFTIELGHVGRIERGDAFGATVTLLDGRSLPLDDSGEVGWDNKGIMVAAEGADLTRASAWRMIPWDDFREVRFAPADLVGEREPGR
jgi:hypothetical protein